MNQPFNPAYIGTRTEIQALVPNGMKTILDVGCSNGQLGTEIKSKTGARVVGIELSAEMGQVARQQIDKVYIGNAEKLLASGLENEKFDLIIFADVLEHLVDPWTALADSLQMLNPGGYVIASIPNIRHISTLYSLLIKGYWPYNERGIHDTTHLRFFTRRNVLELFQDQKLQIDVIDATYRVSDTLSAINLYARRLAVFGLKHVFAYQYLIRARKL
jgi:2-polyprenyl-3-methyl-5-hydroxy-6-metoxy-1,4-benzoquinol methylase